MSGDRVRADLPTGTVTFLFTDIEGSTRLLAELGPRAYSGALAEHRGLLRESFTRQGGVEVDTQGDAFFVAFADAAAAIEAARDAQEALSRGPIRVRMGLHTGQPHLTDEGFVGHDVHLGARIAAAGHGGQVLLSKATTEAVDDAFDLTDLGEHRLKDFPEPTWIYQLGTEPFPPLKTISNTNLPRAASSFVGREREVAEITALLSDGARLVTLTGPGGTGKTRLAIEAASNLVPDFRNGTFWVDLAPVRDEGLVTMTVGQAIGAKNGLAEYIGERELLLVLDNLEQVVDVAPELARIVSLCPNLRLLATSRERLRVRDEVEYAVPPLADSDAVELFHSRSGISSDDNIAELCRRLDNLPLAVELAAARASVLSPGQILERLSKRLDLLKGGRDTEARQQTLRATIEWSHELLTADEQLLFARLGVFSGGWTLEAAESVADADLDVLQSLVDKSLVQHSGERFSMLETIREFAIERLDGTGERELLHRRHAAFFLTLAEEAEPIVLGIDPGSWLDRLEAEHDNIRAALDWLHAVTDTGSALRLGGSLWEFWCLRGHRNEGFKRLEALVELDERPTLARAKALLGSAHLAWNVAGADPTVRRRRDAQALELYQQLGDAWGIAFAEFQLADDFAFDGDFASALRLAEPSVDRLREVGDEHRALQALRTVAWCNLELFGADRAQPYYEQLLEAARVAGDKTLEARALATLAGFASDKGRHQDAFRMLVQVHEIDDSLGDPENTVDDLIAVASAAANAGRSVAALRSLARADVLREEIGSELPPWVEDQRKTALSAVRALLSDDEFTAAWEEGRRMGADEVVKEAVGPDASD